MFAGPIVVFLALGASPAQAPQMSEEVAALHRAVFELPHEQMLPPSAPSRELALRYLNGQGVERDRIQACALLSLAQAGAEWPHHDQEAVDMAEQLQSQHCQGLTRNEQMEVGYVFGCGFIGLNPQTFPLEDGTWVEFSRLGVAIDRPSERTEHFGAADDSCHRRVVLLRRVPLPPLAGWPERHFFERLTWTSGYFRNGLQRKLEWSLLEIADTRVEYHASEILVQESGSGWPVPPLPDAYREGAVFSVSRSGRIRWAFAGSPEHTGTIAPDPKLRSPK